MSIAARLGGIAGPVLNRNPRLRQLAKSLDGMVARRRHSASAIYPGLIRPNPKQITIAVTAHCNLRCAGCRYGRDFMQGAKLTASEVADVLADARSAGVSRARLYGGEPLLHPDLAKMITTAKSVGIAPYITSNGILLHQKVDALYEAGLRLATIGFYGFDVENAPYAGRTTYRNSLERSLSYTRERYGAEIELQLNFVAMGPTCRGFVWRDAWQLARKYGMYFHIDLSSYSTPFFIKDADAGLAVQPEDRPRVHKMVEELLAYKASEPQRFLHSPEFIRSIPDWLYLGAEMPVPCDAYDHIWVGADGSVRLCDTALPLGSIKETRLSDLLFTETHREACVSAFQLRCPNCTCKAETRIQKHAISMRKYGHPEGRDAR